MTYSATLGNVMQHCSSRRLAMRTGNCNTYAKIIDNCAQKLLTQYHRDTMMLRICDFHVVRADSRRPHHQLRRADVCHIMPDVHLCAEFLQHRKRRRVFPITARHHPTNTQQMFCQSTLSDAADADKMHPAWDFTEFHTIVYEKAHCNVYCNTLFVDDNLSVICHIQNARFRSTTFMAI